MNVGTVEVDGQTVAFVEVVPSPSPPVRFNGQVWIRVGPRRAIATLDEERRLAERRRSADLPFDARAAPGSRLDDLNLDLAQLKHYRSLMPLSYEARKPVFALKPADGAFGGHQAAVAAAGVDFAALADRVLDEVGQPMVASRPVHGVV
jgi:hypothetical protein